MGLSFSECGIETPSGTRRALVVSPTSHVVVGRDRLERPFRDGQLSEIDQSIIDAAAERAGRVQLTIFRGATEDGTGSYRFDPSLARPHADELAYRLVREQIAVYRALVDYGLCMHVHCDWGETESDSFRIGNLRLASELEMASKDKSVDRVDRRRHRADVWILRNLCFYFPSRMSPLVTRVLPENLPMMERRMARARQRMLRATDFVAA